MDEAREIVFDEVKLFDCECEVLDINAKHPLLDLSQLCVNDIVIQVQGYDDKFIGAVSFHVRTDDVVIAYLQLEYSCPERLDIETGNVYLDVDWYIDDVLVEDIDVSIEWIEPCAVRLTQKKPFYGATPIKVK